MKAIFLCSTYMQIISAIQIRRNLKNDCIADIIITDHSYDAEKIASSIEKTELFRNVLYIKNKEEIFNQSFCKDILSLLDICIRKNNKYIKSLNGKQDVYDEIYFYNLDFILYPLIDYSCNNGVSPKLFRYEEGMTSYHHMAEFVFDRAILGFRMKIYQWYRKMLGKKLIKDYLVAHYAYFPTMLSSFLPEKYEVRQLPMLSKNDSQTVQILNQIFSYDPKNDLFNEKYIFLASSLDIDGTDSNESDIILDIANQVGRENLLVKMHPRDTRNIYKKNGLKVSTNSYVPWEIILLNHDFSNNVFLSISSGSMLTGPAVIQEDYISYYLYPLVFKQLNEHGKSMVNGTRKVLEQIQHQGKCNNCSVCNTMTQLYDILEK